MRIVTLLFYFGYAIAIILLCPEFAGAGANLITFSSKSAISAEDSLQTGKSENIEHIEIESTVMVSSIELEPENPLPVEWPLNSASSLCLIDDILPGWELKYRQNSPSDDTLLNTYYSDGFKEFHGFKFRTPSQAQKQNDIARSSKYSDAFNAYNYNTGFYTFKISADMLTPPVKDFCLFTTIVPALWLEKSNPNIIEKKRNLSFGYRFLMTYSKSHLAFNGGISGIFFVDKDNVVGEERNHMNYDLNTAIAIIETTRFSFRMRYPITRELRQIAEPNYTVLLTRGF